MRKLEPKNTYVYHPELLEERQKVSHICWSM